MTLVFLTLMSVSAATVSQAVIERFTGSGAGSTESFTVGGPWLLNWETTSDFPQLSYIEIHLYDSQTGRHVGVAVQHRGRGNGEKLIREPGNYRISVAGVATDWAIQIEAAGEELTELLRANPDLAEVRLVEPDTGLSRQLVESVAGWQAENERTLLLRTEDGMQLRATFYGDAACPGVLQTENISFVTSGLRGDTFNAILLEDGTRCYLDGVVRLE